MRGLLRSGKAIKIAGKDGARQRFRWHRDIPKKWTPFLPSCQHGTSNPSLRRLMHCAG